MCLAVPGRVVEWIERNSPFARAAVEFGGVRRQVSMAFVPEANEDDYVLVHAGVAITRIDADEAAQVVETLNELALAGQEESTPGPPDETADGGDEA